MTGVTPIVDDEGHAAALREVERLWDAPEGTPEAARLDVLATLVEAYERARWPRRESSPAEILRYAVEDLGRSEAELAEIVGSRGLATLLLSGERPLTRALAERVSRAWHLPIGTLVRDDD